MADFEYSYIVCNCNQVTLGEIIYAIQDKNAQTIDDIGDITDAGRACGCCKCEKDDFGDPQIKLYLEQIVNKFVQ
jgi:bacterioferritin-associated ferredoxin